MTRTMALHGCGPVGFLTRFVRGRGEAIHLSEGTVTHPVAENVDPMTLTVMTASDGAVIVARGGDLDIAPAPAVRERLLSLPGGALHLAALRPEGDVVAATASRLRRLFPARPRPATG